MRMSKLSLRIAGLRPCPHCNETGGLWDNQHLGRRCPNPKCLKGKLLQQADALREGREALEQELTIAEQAPAAGMGAHA